jgi:hypothetical protein
VQVALSDRSTSEVRFGCVSLPVAPDETDSSDEAPLTLCASQHRACSRSDHIPTLSALRLREGLDAGDQPVERSEVIE